MSRIKGIHFEKEIVELVTNWYVNRQLSCRRIETMMRKRGLHIDHATINRWVNKFKETLVKEPTPPADQSGQWSMQESQAKIRGKMKHLYLFYDAQDQVHDFFVSDEPARSDAVDFYVTEHPFAKRRVEEAPSAALSM